VSKRGVIATSLAGVYLVACGWAHWSRLDAVLLFAVVSPVGASLMFPKDAGVYARMVVGAFIDACLAVLAFLPVLGDVVDLAATLAAVVLVIVRFRQFAIALPGGLACLILYAFLWLEAGFLPHGLVAVFLGVLAGGVILAGLTLLLGLLYSGDRPKAVFSTVGFPWFLITFFLTIFLPNKSVKHAHQSAEVARRA
jgi:hypothetical protein